MATKDNASTQTAGAAAKDAVKKAKAAEEQVENVASKIKTLESQVEKLKILDKAGVHKQFGGFISFLREQSVVGLAIGLVLGTQAKALVDQLMSSFINPLVGLLLPGQGTLKDKSFTLHWGHKAGQFGWGAFVVGLLTFFIVAAVVYFVFKGLKLDKLDKKKEA